MQHTYHTLLGKVIFFLSFAFIFGGCASDSQKELKIQIIETINRHYLEKIELKSTDYLDENTDISEIFKKLDKFSVYIDKNHPQKTKHFGAFESHISQNGVLYMKLPYFYKGISQKIHTILQKNQSQISKIVLDLDDNPGGDFFEAVKILDMFIDEGVLVSIRSRDKYSKKTYFASKKNTLTHKPLQIRVNQKSASSSEIVAGVLQLFKRATIVGEKTYGKGTIQIQLYLDKQKQKGMKLTVSRYYLQGTTANTNGIVPD